MAFLYAPLYELTRCGAVSHLVTGKDGTKSGHLTWRRNSRYAQQNKGKAILARFEGLVVMQLGVCEG